MKKAGIVLLYGIIGAFTAIILDGLCFWSLSVAPDFFLWATLTYLFPVPLVLGTVGSVTSIIISRRYGSINVSIHAFGYAFLSTYLSFPIALFVTSFDMVSDLIHLNQVLIIVFHILTGIIILGILASLILLILRIQEKTRDSLRDG